MKNIYKISVVSVSLFLAACKSDDFEACRKESTAGTQIIQPQNSAKMSQCMQSKGYVLKKGVNPFDQSSWEKS